MFVGVDAHIDPPFIGAFPYVVRRGEGTPPYEGTRTLQQDLKDI